MNGFWLIVLTNNFWYNTHAHSSLWMTNSSKFHNNHRTLQDEKPFFKLNWKYIRSVTCRMVGGNGDFAILSINPIICSYNSPSKIGRGYKKNKTFSRNSKHLQFRQEAQIFPKHHMFLLPTLCININVTQCFFFFQFSFILPLSKHCSTTPTTSGNRSFINSCKKKNYIFLKKKKKPYHISRRSNIRQHCTNTTFLKFWLHWATKIVIFFYFIALILTPKSTSFKPFLKMGCNWSK